MRLTAVVREASTQRIVKLKVCRNSSGAIEYVNIEVYLQYIGSC